MAEGDAAGGPLSVGELWRRTTEAVGDRIQARWLCEVATGLAADEFVAATSEPVTERMIAHLDAMLARWCEGEPLQYVLGRWGFRHLDLAIDRRVLIPRPETEQVAGIAIELTLAAVAERGAATVADLGSGSGAIGLSVAAESPADTVDVWLTDRDPDALDVARANLAGLGRRGTRVRLAEGSWFTALPVGERFDVIVSNPPYVADHAPEVEDSVVDWEPATALFSGPDGLDDIRLLVAGAPEHLRGGGWLVLEIGADQGPAVNDEMLRRGFRSVEILPDASGRDRIARGCWAGVG